MISPRQEVVSLVRDFIMGGREVTSLIILTHIRRSIPDVTLTEVRMAAQEVRHGAM